MGQEASAFEPAYYETLIWLFFLLFGRYR